MDVDVDKAVAAADEHHVGSEGGVEGAGAEVAEEVKACLESSGRAQSTCELEIASGGIAAEIADEELGAALEAHLAADSGENERAGACLVVKAHRAGMSTLHRASAWGIDEFTCRADAEKTVGDHGCTGVAECAAIDDEVRGRTVGGSDAADGIRKCVGTPDGSLSEHCACILEHDGTSADEAVSAAGGSDDERAALHSRRAAE